MPPDGDSQNRAMHDVGVLVQNLRLVSNGHHTPRATSEKRPHHCMEGVITLHHDARRGVPARERAPDLFGMCTSVSGLER
eukprot:3098562-Rhodomonas_salina.1